MLPKGYSESRPLCSWDGIFILLCAFLSTWNWLVCSSSVLNVTCIWGCERLLVPSKHVCGMTLQNTLPAKGFLALKFHWRPFCLDWREKKKGKLPDKSFFKPWNFVFFVVVVVLVDCFAFFFLRGKRNGTWLFTCGQGFLLSWCMCLTVWERDALWNMHASGNKKPYFRARQVLQNWISNTDCFKSSLDRQMMISVMGNNGSGSHWKYDCCIEIHRKK